MAAFRKDGLNSPLSPNGSSDIATWQSVVDACEGSDAVESYDFSGSEIEIVWVDGSTETHNNPHSALHAIAAMTAS